MEKRFQIVEKYGDKYIEDGDNVWIDYPLSLESFILILNDLSYEMERLKETFYDNF